MNQLVTDKSKERLAVDLDPQDPEEAQILDLFHAERRELVPGVTMAKTDMLKAILRKHYLGDIARAL